jgi:putative transposase
VCSVFHQSTHSSSSWTNGEPDGPYGPVGGLPALVRIDRGKDFLSRTVTSALGALAIPVHDLPAYSPHLKGTVENLNRCAERMLFAALPRYTHAPAPSLRRPDRAEDATAPLTFTVRGRSRCAALPGSRPGTGCAG